MFEKWAWYHSAGECESEHNPLRQVLGAMYPEPQTNTSLSILETYSKKQLWMKMKIYVSGICIVALSMMVKNWTLNKWWGVMNLLDPYSMTELTAWKQNNILGKC